VQRYCRVAVDSPVLALDRPFDYAIPDRLHGRVGLGSVVRVPLHGRRLRAFVTELLDDPAVASPRPLSALVSPTPLFGPDQIELARWVARRYVTTVGTVLHDAVPGRYSAPKAPRPVDAPRATAERGARETLWVVAADGEPDVIAEAANTARQTLVICPRVDVIERLAGRIAGAVVLHGDQRPSDRAASWSAAASGAASVVVGGRAALFVPMPSLDLVIVASAHDPGLRAERTPRLHALVVARRRAALVDARFVATSPSPPLDVMGEGVDVVEPRRPGAPTELARPVPTPVTERLVDVVRSATDRGRDALVFVARRGGALRARCDDCGWQAPVGDAPDVCPSCGGRLSKRGWGHGRVASAIERVGVGAPVVRLVRGDEVEAVPAPAVVVGTLAAAHRWPRRFGSVCVADGDQLLGRQDFRAAERALGVLHELAAVLAPGGRFLVQTRESDHHAVQAFVRRSFSYFADRELPLRREAGYPPFGDVVVAEVSSADCAPLISALRTSGAVVLGPVVGRRGDARLLIRTTNVDRVLGPLREFALAHRNVRIDVDPVDVI